MIKRDTTPLDKFLAKVKDASRLGLKEVRIDTRDAVDISTLLAQILLEQQVQKEPLPKEETSGTQLDGGKFK
jgi:hypothetical protein